MKNLKITDNPNGEGVARRDIAKGEELTYDYKKILQRLLPYGLLKCKYSCNIRTNKKGVFI